MPPGATKIGRHSSGFRCNPPDTLAIERGYSTALQVKFGAYLREIRGLSGSDLRHSDN